MKDIMRVAMAVPALRVADVAYNKAALLKCINEAAKQGATLVLTPELSLSGCTCGDLFASDLLLSSCEAALGELAAACPDGVLAVVGTPLLIEGRVFDVAALIGNGQVLALVPKCDLNAAERRHFLSGEELLAECVLLNGEPCDVSPDLQFCTEDGTTLSVAIGNDLSAAPDTEIVLNPTATPSLVGGAERTALAVKARSLQAALCLSVGASLDESTADCIYTGHTFAAMNGKLLLTPDTAAQRDTLKLLDVDLGKIRYDRRRTPVGAIGDELELPLSLQESDGALLQISRLPFVPDEKTAREARCLEIYEMQAAALARRLSITGGKAVLGISGGLDSTLALLVAIRATELLKLPRTNVIAITMPCFGTTDETLQNSLTLMKNLGVDARTVSIKDAVLQHFKDIGQASDDYSVTYENAQARERTQVLMDIANKEGGIVLGTGDLSELALGWCTYNGDHMSMYGVNGGVPKTLLRWIIATVADSGLLPEAREVLLRVLDTPISPELLPPDVAGKIAQKTEDIVGPYALHDFFLYWAVRYQYTPKKIFALAQRAFADVFDGATIKKWLAVFHRRFFNQQFKRNCLPDGAKIGSVGLSPRGDWQMPSDAASALWLAEIDAIQA